MIDERQTNTFSDRIKSPQGEELDEKEQSTPCVCIIIKTSSGKINKGEKNMFAADSVEDLVESNPSTATAPPSAAMSLLSLLKKPSAGAQTEASTRQDSGTGPIPQLLTSTQSLAEIEAAAKRQPLKYTPPAQKQSVAPPEAVDQHVLLHRLVTIIRTSEAGFTLKQVQELYRQQFPPLAKHRKLSDLLPPVAFHPHLVQQLEGGEVHIKFTSTAQSPPPPAKSTLGSPTRSLVDRDPTPSLASTPPRAAVISEPVGQPRCGHLDLAMQITGQSIRNAGQLSVLLQSSLRAVVCRDGKMHSLAGGGKPTAQQHLVLINASLVLQPRENGTLWYTPQTEVDVTRNIEKTWAGANSSSSSSSDNAAHNLSQPVLSFSSANKATWTGNVRNVWVLLSLPGRRLVTLKDGRLLLLGGLLKQNMHIGASNGSWHFPQGSARETEACETAVAACKRAHLPIGAHDNNDRSLIWVSPSEDKAKLSPDRVGKVQHSAPQSKSLVAAAFGDDDSSSDDY